MKKKNKLKFKDFQDCQLLTNNSIKLTNTINYVTANHLDKKEPKAPYFTGDSLDSTSALEWECNDTLPIYLSSGKSILIPKGVKRQVQRLPKTILKKIDINTSVAVEKCLLMISNLSFTVFREGYDKWKSLSSKLLHKQLKKGNDNTFVYKYVIEALKYTTNATSPILETRRNIYGFDTYQSGVISKQFKLGTTFQNQNLVNYDLKSEECIEKRIKQHCEKLKLALENPIAYNLLMVYSKITLPTKEELKVEARKLIKMAYKSKKGKQLTFLNQKAKQYYSNYENRSFVEENIRQFTYLTSKGYLIPIIGDYKSGGRVVDSFNLMPSWIRLLIKIEGENIVELDYRALHPNIAMSIYGGQGKYLSHQQIAKYLEIELNKVKIEHLSFFNKTVSGMKRSFLFNYYSTYELEMLNKIVKDKRHAGYKITSRKLFDREVKIMSVCVKQLNRLGIYVIYVYDALYCKESDKNKVSDIMNRTIKKFKVFTTVK